MLVRAAIFMASIIIGAQAFAADTLNTSRADGAAASHQTVASGEIVVAPPFPGQLADSGNAGGPAAEHAQDLKRIAIYVTIGNRDGAAIATEQLRKAGVTREEMQDAIDRTKLHGGGTNAAPQLRQSKVEFSSGRAMEVSY